jgi:membrane associated rhomboid family serine protease
MLPLRDDNPQVLTPIVTVGVIGLNLAAWVLVQGLGSERALLASICELGLIPGELLGSLTPGQRVSLGPDAACIIGEPHTYTAVTHMFLHGGWGHILGNMWFLWIFGDNVEDAMGHVRFAIFYILCGLAAAGAQMLSDPGSAIPMVGASGAIGGVMGAYIILYPRVHVHSVVILGFYITTFAIPAVAMLGYWFLIQLLSGAVATGTGGGVAFWAHVGGFVAGAVLILLFRDKRLLARHPYHGFRYRQGPTEAWRRTR